MDAAQLFNIDDADQLRAMLLEKLQELAARDDVAAKQNALIAAREAEIKDRDATIAAWSSAVDKRDEIIRHRDITIEALTFELARSDQPDQRLRARLEPALIEQEGAHVRDAFGDVRRV